MTIPGAQWTTTEIDHHHQDQLTPLASFPLCHDAKWTICSCKTLKDTQSM